MQKNAIYQEVGRRIADLRAGLDMTQQQLADRVDMSRASIANTERGKQTVSLHNLYALAAALKVADVSQLLPTPVGGMSKWMDVKSLDAVSAQEFASVNNIINGAIANQGKGRP